MGVSGCGGGPARGVRVRDERVVRPAGCFAIGSDSFLLPWRSCGWSFGSW
jgi:hypothetical protein